MQRARHLILQFSKCQLGHVYFPPNFTIQDGGEDSGLCRIGHKSESLPPSVTTEMECWMVKASLRIMICLMASRSVFCCSTASRFFIEAFNLIKKRLMIMALEPVSS